MFVMVYVVSLTITRLIPVSSKNTFLAVFLPCSCVLVFKEMVKIESQWGC